MLSRKLSRIFYRGFWTHVSSSKPLERKTRRARLAAISSIVFTVKRLVKRQYLLVQTTACNYEVRALRVYFRCKEYLLGIHLMTFNDSISLNLFNALEQKKESEIVCPTNSWKAHCGGATQVHE